jgi:hypothetical protein
MNNLISCCGINCEGCEARIATLKNDDALRAETAKKWAKQFNSPEINITNINCVGCRETGVKMGHWGECKIRLCAVEKGYQTCGECEQMNQCELVGQVFKFLPEAIENLRSLN